MPLDKVTLARFKGSALEGWDPALIERFAGMVFLFDPVESDGGASLVEQLLNTRDVSQLDAPWQQKDEDEILNRWLEIRGAHWEYSDYSEGTGVYLQIDAVDIEKSQRVRVSSGSVSVIAQLAAVQSLGAFPITAMIVRAQKKTKQGFYPKHLEVRK